MDQINYHREQGQSIYKLYTLLYRSSFASSLKRAISMVTEIMLILISIIFIVIALKMPTDPLQFSQELSNTTSIKGVIHNEYISNIMLIIKLSIFSIAIFPILLFIALRRNRKKSRLIQDALTEVEIMKNRYEILQSANASLS